MIDGRTIVIKGDISGSEDLAIAGRVEGSITLKGFKLTLAPDSHVTGKVIAASVIVAGIVGRSRRSRRPRRDSQHGGRARRDLNPTLIVVDGAQLSTQVNMTEGARRTRAA